MNPPSVKNLLVILMVFLALSAIAIFSTDAVLAFELNDSEKSKLGSLENKLKSNEDSAVVVGRVVLCEAYRIVRPG